MPALFPKIAPVPVTLIGLGAVGKSLAEAFTSAGFDLALIGRGRAGERALARALKARYLSRESSIKQATGFIVISVKDDQIKLLSNKLSHLDLPWQRLTVLHTSGVLGSKILKPLAKRGARVAAWHPYQTFPKGGKRITLSGITFGISGELAATRAAIRLTRALGGKPLVLRDEDRILYHLSAVLACGFVVADLGMAVRVLKNIGLSEKRALEAILPIASQTLKNVAELGPERALTGPAVRGDKQTIRRHLAALGRRDPKQAKLYAAVTDYMAQSR